MPRALRYQYPGAVYHLMARGDGGKVGKVCEDRGWRVHAWVLMSNHFHLLVETPEANLVTGVKMLLGTFSQGWNRRRMRRGHVFQGRNKSIPVNASDSDPYHFKLVADYIHLNPARAGLAGGKKGKLLGYRWSSHASHARGNGPDWLETGRLLQAFELAGDGRGMTRITVTGRAAGMSRCLTGIMWITSWTGTCIIPTATIATTTGRWKWWRKLETAKNLLAKTA